MQDLEVLQRHRGNEAADSARLLRRLTLYGLRILNGWENRTGSCLFSSVAAGLWVQQYRPDVLISEDPDVINVALASLRDLWLDDAEDREKKERALAVAWLRENALSYSIQVSEHHHIAMICESYVAFPSRANHSQISWCAPAPTPTLMLHPASNACVTSTRTRPRGVTTCVW